MDKKRDFLKKWYFFEKYLQTWPGRICLLLVGVVLLMCVNLGMQKVFAEEEEVLYMAGSSANVTPGLYKGTSTSACTASTALALGDKLTFKIAGAVVGTVEEGKMQSSSSVILPTTTTVGNGSNNVNIQWYRVMNGQVL